MSDAFVADLLTNGLGLTMIFNSTFEAQNKGESCGW
jgi:hypothetical protein